MCFTTNARDVTEKSILVPAEEQSKISELIINLVLRISWPCAYVRKTLLEFLDENTLDENCKFCAIIQDEKEAVTNIHHGPWDKEVLVLQPIGPATEGHVLVIPRMHVLDSRPARVFAKSAFWASKVAETLYPNADVNFQLNQGQYAGQSVGHAHIHVVRRLKGDELPQFWDGQEKGHYNTVGKPEHPEHVKPRTYKKATATEVK
jgi:histidine triad (HIT) family protein